MAAFITLTTDWKNEDYYVGAVKGRILNLCPTSSVIDITHKVETYNIAHAAFILKNCFSRFPSGTIHIVAVRSEAVNGKPHIATRYGDHFFITADNGIMSIIMESDPQSIVQIIKFGDPGSFPEVAVFAEAAAHLASGNQLTDLGPATQKYYQIPWYHPNIDEFSIFGRIICFDSYGNAITNISAGLLEQIGKGRRFDIFVNSFNNKISKISSHYYDVPEGEVLALINSSGLLEIAQNSGNTKEVFKIDLTSNITVRYYDPPRS